MISICLNTYNRTELLLKSLKSLQYQTCRGFEVIIANHIDDITEKAIEEVSKNVDYKIKLIKYTSDKFKGKPNKFLIGWNIAVNYSNNERILMTVPDVLHDKRNIENAFKLYNSKKAIFGSCIYITSKDFDNIIYHEGEFDKTKYNNFLLDLYKMTNSRKYCYPILYPDYWLGTYFYATLLSKEAYNKIGGIDLAFMDGFTKADDDFGSRLKKSGIRIEYTTDLYTLHLYHSVRNLDTALAKKNEILWHKNMNGHCKKNINFDYEKFVIDVKEWN